MKLEELVQRVVQNNPQGILLNLVSLGKMLPGSNVSVQDMVAVIEVEINRENSTKFLLDTFDVAVKTDGLYANELYQLSNAKGKTIRMVMQELITDSDNNSFLGSFQVRANNAFIVPEWARGLALVLMGIGLIVVLRLAWKVAGKIIN
jgi:hypothetical protein